MKFRILMLLLCLATFSVCMAQVPAPPIEPNPETTEQVVIIDLAGFEVASEVVEEIALCADDPGFVATNAQSPGEVLPFKRNPPTTSFDEDYPEPAHGLLASNLQLPDGDDDPGEPDEPFDLWAWLTSFLQSLVPEDVLGYIGAFLMVGETLVRLTPTTEDDKWFLWVKRIIDTIFPSRKKGGGTFPKANNTPV